MMQQLRPPSAFTRDELVALWAGFKQECFRLETFPEYRVPGEAKIVEAYMAGEPLPPPSQTPSVWEGLIRSAADRGASFNRVHIMPDKINPYLRYALEWGYSKHGAAGENIFFLPQARLTEELRRHAHQDFFLFDGKTEHSTTVVYLYGPNGELPTTGGYAKAHETDTRHYVNVRDLAMNAPGLIPLKDYLKMYRHGDLD
jgi:hypothetical protein